MHNNKEELMKELIKKRANGEIESDPLVTNPIWEDEMLNEQIKNTTDEDIEKFCEMLGLTRKPDHILVLDGKVEHIKNSVERKRQLMRLEKEHLVDMVFNLESRNEFLVHNLSEVEKMHNKLKARVDELETEVFSLRNQNKLWECIAEGYKKKEQEEKE